MCASQAPPTLMKAMENEHCAGPDAQDSFSTSNGMVTTSPLEWEVVTYPKKKPDTEDGRQATYLHYLLPTISYLLMISAPLLKISP